MHCTLHVDDTMNASHLIITNQIMQAVAAGKYSPPPHTHTLAVMVQHCARNTDDKFQFYIIVAAMC